MPSPHAGTHRRQNEGNGLFPFTWIMDPMRFAVPTSEKSEEAVIVFFTARSLVSVSVTE